MRKELCSHAVIFSFGIVVMLSVGQRGLAQEEAPPEEKDLYFGMQTPRGTGFNFISVTGRQVDEPDFELGPGMEVVTIGKANIIVPKGTRVENKGSWIKVEDLGEYLGRNFDSLDSRLKKLEAAQEEIAKGLAKLASSIEELRSKALVSEEKK